MSEDGLRQSEVFYSGRVQGVGFRYNVRAVARGFQVTGFVRNLTDGRVQVVVEGELSEIEAFLGAIKTEMASYIREIQESDRSATDRFSNFEIRF